MGTRRTDPASAPPPLDAMAVCLLLRGQYNCPCHPGAATEDYADLYFGGEPRVAEVWRQHEAWLKSEARRLGIRPEFGGLFYGEFALYDAARRGDSRWQRG